MDDAPVAANHPVPPLRSQAEGLSGQMAKNWTEQDYAKAGYRTVKLRLSAAAGEALDKLTEPRKVSAFVSGLILGAWEKSTSGKKKRAKPG